MIRNTTASWGSVARWFHWILGVAIIGMLAYGWWMNHIPARPDRFFYRSIHADIGYLILLLMALRLIWRGINPTPALPSDTSPWNRLAARISHGALYTAVVLFNVPQFTSPDKAAASFYEDWHIYTAYVLLALTVIHIAAAAWHHFIKRDRVAARMLDGAPG
jgi:cytochrome b561